MIVALDVDDRRRAMALVDLLGDLVTTYKVGLELLTAAGPEVVSALVAAEKSVFLDLKLHEIPQSVASAVRVCGSLGVSMVTVHASAGAAALDAAVDAAADRAGLRVLALTVITSLDDAGLAEVGVPDGAAAQVGRLARLAVAAGCDGLVTSPQEVRAVRALDPSPGLVVVPGVRLPAGDLEPDHRRAGTLGAALADGASHVVVGRGVTRADDPRAALLAAHRAAAAPGRSSVEHGPG